jgi:nitrate/TMAO reductase-like tetraheme cytochrome c subunit
MNEQMAKPEGARHRLWRRPRWRLMLGIPLGGLLMFVIGVAFWVTFTRVVEETSTLDFCTSCHEMSWVYAEYQESVHYKNASGVSAICADCHVPRPFFEKMARKIKATVVEVPAALSGKIDTKEKFEAERLRLARNVWEEMRANNSQKCRHCHTLEKMALDKQSRSAQRRHDPERLKESGDTCIDCHEGVAHKLPENY